MSTTIEHDGFTIESNHETEAAMRAAMEIPPAADATAEASADGEVDAAASTEPSQSAEAVASVNAESEPVRKPKPRENTQARISQAIAKQHEAERKAAELEARLQALEQSRQQPTREEPKPAAKPVDPSKPSWKVFEAQIGETYETWADAQDAFSDARDTWNRQQWQEEQRHQQEQSERLHAGQTHRERVTAAKARYPDYDAVVEAVSTIPVSAVLEQAILASPNSADVVYWLATHRDEFSQLASETQSLGVVAAPLVRRLLEARLGAGERSGSVPTAELSTAKPPIRPVGVSSVTVSDDDEDVPIETWISRENAKDRKKGRL